MKRHILLLLFSLGTSIGEINVPLASISRAEKLTVDVSMDNNIYKNSYPF